MSIYHAVESLSYYFNSRRRCGHTTVMLEGAKNHDCIIVAINQAHAQTLQAAAPNARIVPLGFVGAHGLVGHGKPLVIDNGAMAHLLGDALREFDRLKLENERLRQKIASAQASLI